MANKQIGNGTSPKAIQGPIDRVPCPHCGRHNDFRQLKGQQLLDTGHCMFCDHCGRSMEVVRIATVELVVVRQDPTGKVAPQRVAAARAQLAQKQRQAQQKKPGILGGLGRLLGKG